MSYAISDEDKNSIAIIGMSCRFPGSDTLHEFWENLCTGKELITFFNKDELLASGIDKDILNAENFVAAKGYLHNLEYFSRSHFGFSKRDADTIDPQYKLFWELVSEALQDAALCTEKINDKVGVYAGCNTLNNYLYQNLLPNNNLMKNISPYQLMLNNSSDFFASRTSYLFNLTGPSVFVHSACSTGLLAINMACQSLLDYQCDIAVAGAANIMGPVKNGYLHQEGMIYSPDGHCRPFDEKANGIVPGDGAGVIILKRLEEAVANRDHIYAIIKGSATNNDGKDKISFTAPSVNGQADVIAEALAMANINADEVSYIEAHGTATNLGDPIEIDALNKVFSEQSNKKSFCSIGSVKSNLGHLDVAAGIAGFIKTVLAIYYGKIPPTLHYTNPNHQIDFSNSAFYVNSELIKWNSEPRYAGVSSFGIGGTNAHIILKQAPSILPNEDPLGNLKKYIFIFSADSKQELSNLLNRTATFLQNNMHLSLVDIAYTLQHGRKQHLQRIALIADNMQDFILALLAEATTLNSQDNFNESSLTDIQLLCLQKFIDLKISVEDMPCAEKIQLLSNPHEYQSLLDFFENNSQQQWSIINVLKLAWESGINVEWNVFQPICAYFVSLPPVHYEKERCWIDLEKDSQSSIITTAQPQNLKQPLSQWFWSPHWRKNNLPKSLSSNHELSLEDEVFLIVINNKNDIMQTHLYNKLRKMVSRCITVTHQITDRYEHLESNHLQFNTYKLENFDKLFLELKKLKNFPSQIIFFNPNIEEDTINTSQQYFNRLVSMIRPLCTHALLKPIKIHVLTHHCYQQTRCGLLDPSHASLEGITKVISQEISNIGIKIVDFSTDPLAACDDIINEIYFNEPSFTILYRDGQRYVQDYVPLYYPSNQLSSNSILKNNGIYLITGGLGGMGLIIAKAIATIAQCTIILAARSYFPPQDAWSDILNQPSSQYFDKVKTLYDIEKSGSKVIIITMDVSCCNSVTATIAYINQHHGKINGVIHAAGNINPEDMSMLSTISETDYEKHFSAKVKGLENLMSALQAEQLDFWYLMSSLSAIIGGVKFAAYAAANAYLNSVADSKHNISSTKWLSVCWDGWIYNHQKDQPEFSNLQNILITPEDGHQIFLDLFKLDFGPVVIISARNFAERIVLCNKISSYPFLSSNDNSSQLANYTAQQISSKIKTVWEEGLGLSEIALHEKFYELGGDSILAIELSEKLRSILGIKLSPTHFLEDLTLAQQIDFILEQLPQN